MLKKFGALVLALLMVVSVSTVAFAADFANGVAGEWTTPDKVTLDNDRSINIKKDLKAYNATSTAVFAPVFSYKYTVTPAELSSFEVTDAPDTHSPEGSVTAPVNAGITTGLKVNNGTAGSDASAVGYLGFTNTTSLTASSSGAVNSYNITLDFTSVSFTQPGVYRYKIAETVVGSDPDTAVGYNDIAIKDNDATNANTRWLDVYVDGTGKIYGYVCMAANSSVTKDTDKTNGFVDSSDGEDEYYTYDLELSKTVQNDNYGKNHKFPFTVIFNNTANYANTSFRITETAGDSDGISPAAGLPTWSGIAKVKDGAAITYTGIPAGVDVDVYETNDMTGVTYKVSTSVNGGAAVIDNNVPWDKTPTTVKAQTDTNKTAYESTKATVDTTLNTAVTAKQTLNITNTLLLISPTGVVLRIAPYVMILAAGIALLLISRRRKAGAEE